MNYQCAVLSIIATIGLLMVGCSSSPDYQIGRTLHVSAAKLAEIKRKPYVKRYQSGGGPAARLAGLEDDPWPDGILFLEYGPYLEELGFAKGQALVEIDGKGVHDIFLDRWEKFRSVRPRAFHKHHYKDLIQYLFDRSPGDQLVVTMYLNVPGSESEIRNYTQEIEHWQIIFDH